MTSTYDAPSFRPLSLLLAMVFPGLGHMIAGEVKRGLCIAFGILFLFFGGMFIGGIDVIDSKEDRIWFFGQALIGPIAFGVDHVHQTRFKVIDPLNKQLRSAYPGEGRDPKTGWARVPGTPPNKKSIAKMNELGTLFATIAGMLNLIVIIDAGFPSPRPRPSNGRATPEKAPAAGAAA